jgi:outer membrane lipoprotein-sorting protein
MRSPSSFVVLIATIILPVVPGFGAPPADDPLAAVLARMDATAAKFKGIKADMKYVTHTEVIDKDEIDLGTIAVKRNAKSKDLHMLVDFQQPDAKKVLVTGSKAWLYILKTPNEVQEYDLSRKFRGMLDQYLLLGFGSNSRELRDAYIVKLGEPATETVAGSPSLTM